MAENLVDWLLWNGVIRVKAVLKQMLQKAQSLWAWLRGVSFFGELLPVLLVALLFLALAFYISVEIWGIIYGTENISGGLKKLTLLISSDRVRNLSLLLVASIGWYFLYRRTITAEQNTEAAQQSAEATRHNAVTAEKGLTTERLTRTIDQLTHEKTATRLGGILGLEQIALTQKEESQKIARILATFIRTRAAKDSDETKKEIAASGVSKLEPGDDFSKYRVQRLDVEVAVHTLANIASELEKRGEFQEFLQYNKSKQDLCDLRDIDLRGLQLNKVNFSNFNLIGTDFSYAWLAEANFTKAGLFFPFSPILKEENKTKFIGAILESSNFSDTQLNYVDFSNSILVFANFDRADLGHAIFDGCRINYTYFETSRNLTQEQIDKAFYLDDNLIPFLPKGLNLPRPLTTGTPSRSDCDKLPAKSDN